MITHDKSLFRAAACAAACAIAAGGSASAQFSFAVPVNVPAGTNPTGAAAADFDGDGDMDVATTADGPERIVILRNDGSGTFAAGPPSALPASSSPQDLIAGDLDGDGDMDLAVAIRDPQGAVMIMANNGAGLFTSIGTVPVGNRPRGFAIGDLEPDGDMDLAVANRDSGTASVLTNNGLGAFTAATVAVSTETRGTAFGDFDGDLDLDLAVTNNADRTVATFLNSGGVFSPWLALPIGPVVRPDGIASADLDNDGDVDLAAASSDASLNISRAVVYLNNGLGFAAAVQYNTGGLNASRIATGDFHCDGLLDLVVVHTDSGNVAVLDNLGNGTFGLPALMAAGTSPEEVTVRDLDGDADADIAVANRDSNNVSFFMNETCQPCPWDIGGDGVVNVVDFLALLQAWGPNPGHPADIDGSGEVDTIDFLALLQNWGACP